MEQYYSLRFTGEFKDIESFRRGRREIEGYFSEGFFTTSYSRPPTSYIYIIPGVSFQFVADEEKMFISLGVKEFIPEITSRHLSEIKEIFAEFDIKNDNVVPLHS